MLTLNKNQEVATEAWLYLVILLIDLTCYRIALQDENQRVIWNLFFDRSSPSYFLLIDHFLSLLAVMLHTKLQQNMHSTELNFAVAQQ